MEGESKFGGGGGGGDGGAPERTEFEDSPTELATKLDALVGLVKASKRTVVFTGAGVSTAAGIRDFRGDGGLDKNPVPLVMIGAFEKKLEWLRPTAGHMGIAAMVANGVVDFVATSNHDGLHEKSGVPSDRIANVFGNVYVEQCGACKAEFQRGCITPHLGRKCETCGGRLRKTGTRMGAMTPEVPLARATAAAEGADLALVFGSSMTVSPFCNLPGLASRMVLVNLQETAFDSDAELTIHAKCDDVVAHLCDAMGLALPTLHYEQPVAVEHGPDARPGYWSVRVCSSATNETPTSVESAQARAVVMAGDAAEDVRMDDSFGWVDLEVDTRREHRGAVRLPAAAGTAVGLQVRLVLVDALALPPKLVTLPLTSGPTATAALPAVTATVATPVRLSYAYDSVTESVKKVEK